MLTISGNSGQKQSPEVFHKKAVLKKILNICRKTPVLEYLINKSYICERMSLYGRQIIFHFLDPLGLMDCEKNSHRSLIFVIKFRDEVNVNIA